MTFASSSSSLPKRSIIGHCTKQGVSSWHMLSCPANPYYNQLTAFVPKSQALWPIVQVFQQYPPLSKGLFLNKFILKFTSF
jgi:hypothetical protein